MLDGFDVRVSDYDGLPVKNKLPGGLRDCYRTRRQWLAIGCVPSDIASAVPMHPNAMNKKLVEYFHRDDVVALSGGIEIPRNCLTCRTRTQAGYCMVAGGYVGETNCCSEWGRRF